MIFSTLKRTLIFYLEISRLFGNSFARSALARQPTRK
jgi:hypothetical protein